MIRRVDYDYRARSVYVRGSVLIPLESDGWRWLQTGRLNERAHSHHFSVV